MVMHAVMDGSGKNVDQIQWEGKKALYPDQTHIRAAYSADLCGLVRDCLNPVPDMRSTPEMLLKRIERMMPDEARVMRGQRALTASTDQRVRLGLTDAYAVGMALSPDQVLVRL